MKGLNIYCDESMHLEAQKGPAAWGAISVPRAKVKEYLRDITALKTGCGISRRNEMKWVNVRKSRLCAYKKLIDFFFEHDDLHMRIVALRDKRVLTHDAYSQTHDEWYYKMYFVLLNHMISQDRETRIFIDEKDTIGSEKVCRLHDVLSRNEYDFNYELIKYVQEVKSYEIGFLSIVDIFLGAINYLNRGLQTSPAKLELIKHIQECSGLALTKTTFLSARKLNIFYWKDDANV